LGKWLLKAEVTKQEGNFIKVGGASIPIKILSTEIRFNILSPIKDEIGTNSRVKFKIELTYPDSSPAKGADLEAYLSNGEVIKLFEKSDGIYEGDYFVDIGDVGTLDIEIITKDAEKNIGISEQTLFVIKKSVVENLLAYLQEGIKKFWWAIIIFLIAVFFIYRPTFEISWINRKLKIAEMEQKKISLMQKETEKRYYKDGGLSKKEFKELMNKYEERMSRQKENEKEYSKLLKEKMNLLRK
tara:strand:- start:295 stop:1020 length:726 start_codon:yes stop_codon:yes gene_type:complete